MKDTAIALREEVNSPTRHSPDLEKSEPIDFPITPQKKNSHTEPERKGPWIRSITILPPYFYARKPKIHPQNGNDEDVLEINASIHDLVVE